ncbi:cytochrome P450 4g15-like [Cimex lectularius]|uniref:Cytochrome P450 n=1 Tax=Cimex lectularius TaxID=79782 RepID=A0A8I6RNP5_CIMLE|nr:cytochrome P450 4g15-like [Cimex lectularius]
MWSTMLSLFQDVETLILIPFAAFLVYFCWAESRNRLYELADKIPGPPGYPIIGNALEFLGSPHKIFDNLVAKGDIYTDVAKLWIGPRLIVFLFHPADIELVLSSHEHLDKSAEYAFLRPWLGNGLLTSTGEKWRAHRRLIAPTFHLNVLRSFMVRFNDNAKVVVRRMKEEGDNVFDVHDYMSECTVETLIETVMGVKSQTKNRNCYDYAMAVMKLCDIIHSRQVKVWLRPKFLFYFSKYGMVQKALLGKIHGLTSMVLTKKQEEVFSGVKSDTVEDTEFEEVKTTKGFSFGQASGLRDDLDVDLDIGEKKRLPFLESMIERSQFKMDITDKEVKEQLDTIMFEGHDTTAAASSFFFCIMASRPDIQKKCVEELYSIFGDSDRDVTFQDTMEMKYLERCLMETLRLYPPVPLIAREMKKELKIVSKNLTIPANCTVCIVPYKLHRRDDVYPNPNHFDPDNFLPEKSAKRHFYAFIPFSAGPRSCVGRKYAMLKLKTILATVLRNFHVKPGCLEDRWDLQADIILKRSDGFNIQLEPRKSLKV